MDEKVYIRRLRRRSVAELIRLKDHLAGDMARRNAKAMMGCIVAAIMAKVTSP